MIKKLRWKFVGFFMLFAVVLLCFALTTIAISLITNTATVNETQLKEALVSPTPQSSAPRENSPITVPYFTVEIFAGGTAYTSNTETFGLDSDQVLSIIEQTLSTKATSGILKGNHLRFYIEKNPVSTKIAYMSSVAEETAAKKIVSLSIILGLGSLLVLFGVSYFLSFLATNPVDKAWQQQKQFISDASHELKTPLTVILSSADLLEDSKDSATAPYIENIREEGLRMKKLIENMLTLSRLEKVPTLSFISVDFSDIVTDALLRFEPVAFENGHEILSNIQDNIVLNGDAAQLNQLCGILLDNAIKYASQNTPIRLSLTIQGKSAQLQVSNTCPPIPPDKISHLFDRFYRADESRGVTEGYGLGLSIAQNIAALHRGKIHCTSSEETTFTVLIPLN